MMEWKLIYNNNKESFMKLIIFTGPPASGKSSIAKFVAEERKIFFTISILSKFICPG